MMIRQISVINKRMQGTIDLPLGAELNSQIGQKFVAQKGPVCRALLVL